MFCDKHEGLPADQRCGRLAGHRPPCEPDGSGPQGERFWSDLRDISPASESAPTQAPGASAVRIVYTLADGGEVSFDIPGDTTPSQFDDAFAEGMRGLGYCHDAREEGAPVTKRRWRAATLTIVRDPAGSDR